MRTKSEVIQTPSRCMLDRSSRPSKPQSPKAILTSNGARITPHQGTRAPVIHYPHKSARVLAKPKNERMIPTAPTPSYPTPAMFASKSWAKTLAGICGNWVLSGSCDVAAPGRNVGPANRCGMNGGVPVVTTMKERAEMSSAPRRLDLPRHVHFAMPLSSRGYFIPTSFPSQTH